MRDPAMDRPSRGTGFNFTVHMHHLCADMIRRVPDLAHIRASAVAVAFSQTRKSVSHGLQAALTPLRFEGGALIECRNGSRYTVQRLYDASGREQLYILTFYLPRFLQGSLPEKLATVAHELWHIGPRCDGDLRRHPGRYYAHGSSQKQFDACAQRIVTQWLAGNPPRSQYAFLECDYHALTRRYGRVYGTRIPTPKLIRL